MWSMLGTSWAHVEPMLGLCWPMYVRPRLGLRWRMLAYVGPMLSHFGGYVGDMLAILGLFWGYVGNLCCKHLPIQRFTIFSFPQSKNHGRTYVIFNIAKMKFSAAEGPKTL